MSFLGIEAHLPARREPNTLSEIFRSKKTILPKRSTKVTKPTTESCLKPASPNTHHYNRFHVSSDITSRPKRILARTEKGVEMGDITDLREGGVRMAGTSSGSYLVAESGVGAVRTPGFYLQEIAYLQFLMITFLNSREETVWNVSATQCDVILK